MTAPTPSGAPGAPADGGTGGQAQPGTQQPHTTPPAPTGQQAPGAPAQQPTEPQDVQSLPAWAQKIINDTRAEAAQHRTEKQTATQAATSAQKQRDAILKTLGVNPDGTEVPPDPATQVEQAQAVAWLTSVENQVLRIKDIDADRLLDSMAFMNSLDELAVEDPTSPAFKAKLAAHVKKYVDENPRFKAAPGTVRTGADLNGGPGQQPTTLDQQIAEATKARDFTRVIALKRQRATTQGTT